MIDPPTTNQGPIQLMGHYEVPGMLAPRQPCVVFGLDADGQPAADLYVGHPGTGRPVLVGVKRVVMPDPEKPVEGGESDWGGSG